MENMLDFDFDKMLFTIPKDQHDPETLRKLLDEHKEVHFVSFVGIDIGGHDTDEKIPISTFIKDMENMLKHGVQTDGSSVALPGIADLGNAKVDIIPDLDVNWFIDYNYQYIGWHTKLPVGTLRIPSFLVHNDAFECGSRATLKNAIRYFKESIMEELRKHPYVFENISGADSVDDIEELIVTSATELEFWVKTPDDKGDREQLFTAQMLKERFDNIGIRMVYKIADEVSYQNLLGLNVLTILIKETDLVTELRTDYMLERRLRELDPDLHRRFMDTAFVSQRILTKFRLLFPEYTDHSELHSLTVIDSCNRLVGTEQIDMLSKSDIYVLLMAGYLHDVGMGISEKDYEEFKDALGAEQYFKDHPDDTRADFVRTYHNEFSGLFIEKYAPLFDMPSEEFVFAIKQVSRGHRKTDLYDEKEYPADYRMPDGTTVCLPYLAALIRLTDEIDVAASRNPLILYDIDLLTNEVSIQENRKLMAVEHLEMTKSSFILHTHEKDPEILDALDRAIVKMQATLDLCRDVTEKRTPFRITQKKVVLIRH